MRFDESEKSLFIEDAEDVKLVSEALISTANFECGHSVGKIDTFPHKLDVALSKTALWSLRDVIKHHYDISTRISTAVALEGAGIEYDASYLHPLYRQVIKDKLDVEVVEVS